MQRLRMSLLAKVRRITRWGLTLLPKPIRYPIYRRMVRFEFDPPAELEIRLARSQEELAAAFRLVHESYLAEGFTRPNESGMRITRYHALPSTSTVIALWDGRVVGTLSVIRDGVFGLPSDQIFDLSRLRKSGERLAEISSLAIHADFRRTQGRILFPLQKFMTEYCLRYFGVDRWVIAVNPKHVEYYESILCFRRLNCKVVARYEFAGGAPAVGMSTKLSELRSVFESRYASRRSEGNWFRYLYQHSLPNLLFPARSYVRICDPVMTPKMLDYFFRRQSDVFAKLSDPERKLLRATYNHNAYAAVLPTVLDRQSGDFLPRARRHEEDCPGTMQLGGRWRAIALRVREVSATGFRARLEQAPHVGEMVSARIEIGAGRAATLLARLIWNDANGTGGFRIERAPREWHQLIDHLDSELLRKKAA